MLQLKVRSDGGREAIEEAMPRLLPPKLQISSSNRPTGSFRKKCSVRETQVNSMESLVRLGCVQKFELAIQLDGSTVVEAIVHFMLVKDWGR